MAEPVLSVRGLSKSFGALKATDDVTLTLKRGEIHALIGPNGAGKSTLIRQITGEIRQDSGEIRLGEAEISALSTQARARRGLARSFQVSSLAPEFTVLENVMLAVAGASGRRLGLIRPATGDGALTTPARRHIARAGLEGRENARAADLSHGERRSLEIAMALALEPVAFLLDEPMAGMGPEGSERLTALLSGLRAQAPILLVEHDMDAVFALADRISVLVYGALIATGTVEEIRADAEVRRAYLGEEG
ncbi:ABC transporter ATP-binding protein [Pikeienuella piscinae]|uniref:ABC transporter ATP-binding protein n=1 Tax=Pikeienuella piscinae TaxID=2748098 RepID=A0A7M3T643_9RHOB|nr:ABC transporter ATP-binding protein [Pikeienuella piscinae]QIE57474.1 ABC transporter ATP-binding protein [Pikeienuella piscinae]